MGIGLFIFGFGLGGAVGAAMTWRIWRDAIQRGIDPLGVAGDSAAQYQSGNESPDLQQASGSWHRPIVPNTFSCCRCCCQR